MRYSIFALLVLATILAASLTGCTGQRGGGDQSMSSSGMQSASGDNLPGRGVEDPRG